MLTAPLVIIENLSKRFGATQALDKVSLTINSHEILALLGANGAGKSTIIKILAKIYLPDSGTITGANQKPLEQINFSFIHQDLGLVEWMSVAESVALGSGYPRKMGLIDWAAVRKRAYDALSNVAPHINPSAQINSLSRADRSLVAIARALYNRADVLVLDEPTASLHASDCENLFSVLRRLRDDGTAIVYVSHRLDEIFKVAGRVIVLRDGKLIEDGLITEFNSQNLVKAIVGRETKAFELGEFTHGSCVLKVEELHGPNFRGCSFELKSGEVLGLIGLNGAGQREVGRTIAGALPKYSGKVILQGKIVGGTLSDIVKSGISLITSSRIEEGLFPSLTVRENSFPNLPARGFKFYTPLNHKKERAEMRKINEEFNVKPRTTELSIATLSGGNQQKVILARWLSMQRAVIVLEEPTAGVDVGAKVDIYQFIERATKEGLSILLVSTDFEEVNLMAHRALVFSEGAIVKELSRSEITIENLVTYASKATVGV
jgi:ribose transport system ATP-binding protein